MFGDGDRLYREPSRAAGDKAGDKEELQAATVDAECSTGRRTITLVPLPSPSELISRLPPSCRTRSRMPRSPTPGVPVSATSSCFARESPLPSSATVDRKSTRLNSSHQIISYAVFCLKKKKIH